MSLRSEIVIENNLKPSQFGKPVTGNEDDFEEIYESPLEKLKPLPPRLSVEALRELPRNEPEIMEFSNARKTFRNSNNGSGENGKILTLDKPSGYSQNVRNSKECSLPKSRISASSGITNEGFDHSSEEKLRQNLTEAYSENLVTVESQDMKRNSDPSPIDNGKKRIEDKTDMNFRTIVHVIKSLDVNRYATKKTIAQGMLDIALLTANASQLKYILQVGKQHEFYILMLSLISVSIGLQVIQGVICVLLGSTFNINKQQDQRKANVWNNICLVLMVLTVAVNAVISAFDMRDNLALTSANITRGASTRFASGVR